MKHGANDNLYYYYNLSKIGPPLKITLNEVVVKGAFLSKVHLPIFMP